MIADAASAYCCCIAALATLKKQFPARIKDSGGTEHEITYKNENGSTICSCGSYFAYAISDEKDFSLHFNGISTEFTAENNELVKSIFKTAAKVLNGICGAGLYLHAKGELNETISVT